jgi:hypothetical protein
MSLTLEIESHLSEILLFQLTAIEAFDNVFLPMLFRTDVFMDQGVDWIDCALSSCIEWIMLL